jgi:hypothetical protein
MPARVRLDITFKRLTAPTIDNDAITRWIERRLNNARNIFIRKVSGGDKHGRIYRRGNVVHRASAPGEFPATDHGRLVNSVDYRMISPLEGSLFSEINYADFLVRGTPRMDKRKMLAEAVEESVAQAPLPPGVIRMDPR